MDRRLEVVDAMKYSAPDALYRDVPEEPLDQVDP